MGCIYRDNEEICSLYEEGHTGSPNGCDGDGGCWAADDPDPNVGCDQYESDWTCNGCGADLNIEECTCEDE
jgi:hypothetical protein